MEPADFFDQPFDIDDQDSDGHFAFVTDVHGHECDS